MISWGIASPVTLKSQNASKYNIHNSIRSSVFWSTFTVLQNNFLTLGKRWFTNTWMERKKHIKIIAEVFKQIYLRKKPVVFPTLPNEYFPNLPENKSKCLDIFKKRDNCLISVRFRKHALGAFLRHKMCVQCKKVIFIVIRNVF